MGLAISQQFIRLMGGQITLVSEVGKGSTFHFEVPVRPADEGFVSKHMGTGRVTGLQSTQPVRRVLIADDDANNRGWLSRLLK